MILVRDEKKHIRCARCYTPLIEKEVVKDRFLPRECSFNISPAINYVGVCKACHKERLKVKVRFPSFWTRLNNEQRDNMTRQMRNVRSQLIYQTDDKEILEAISRL